MFKFFNSAPEGESVYNFVTKSDPSKERPKNGLSRPPRYRSVHSSMVREEVTRNRAWPRKTMGVPEIVCEGPAFFLRKHSRRPLSIRPVSVPAVFPKEKEVQANVNEASEKTDIRPVSTPLKPKPGLDTKTSSQRLPETRSTRLCNSHRKPAIPPAAHGFEVIVQETKDFVKSNAVSVIKARAKTSRPRYVDTNRGTTQEWQNSGLAPNYVLRQHFTRIPKYLVERKKELIDTRHKEEEEAQKNNVSPLRRLDKDDIDGMVEGLKKNWNDIFILYQSLPLLIDTPGKIKRKTSLEALLKKLETDIQALQRHDCILVADVPRAFYASSIYRR